jgi:phage-related protein
MDTLDLIPDWSSTRKLSTENREMQLGDGYRQIASGGVHAIAEIWEISKTGITTARTDEYLEQFTQWGGVQAFWWSPYDPYDPELRKAYYCKNWGQTPLGPNCWQFRATLILDHLRNAPEYDGDGGYY